MSRSMVAALLAVLVAVPARAQQEHARYDFRVAVDGQEQILTYEGTHDVMQSRDAAVKLVVFVHHGGSQNPVTYYNSMKAALDAAAADRPELNLARTTMIIAPGMIGEQHIADRPERYSKGHYGAIALDKNGNFATPYTDSGMYRGWVREDGVIEVRIYDR